jgi:DNA-binding LacI/PurR family transcriptional regulator
MMDVTGHVTGNISLDFIHPILPVSLVRSSCAAGDPYPKATSMPRSHPTIRDVAKEAGVSHQTVSRVINESARVRPNTRARVEKAIEHLGYRPNAIARFMAQGRTHTLACIAPNLSDYTFARIIEGAEAEARRQGYFLFTASASDENTFAGLIAELVESRRTEGLLIINPYQDDRHRLAPLDFPVVYLAAAPRDRAIYSVSLDDEKGGYDATSHLLDLGHRQIAMITGPKIEDCTLDRTVGYHKALEAAGVPDDEGLVRQGDWSATSGYEGVSSLLAAGQPFTGIFAQNDRMAVGAVRALREAGRRVPEDVSIIGFDDMPLASYFHPPLTTMRQDVEEIGREAAGLLIQVLENKVIPEIHHMLSPALIIRDSTKPI